MIIRDHWYVACPSSQLGESTPRAVQVGDEHLVVFRTEAGEPRALLDRCPHRGVRLSLGRVRQGRIACGYHGWEYDGAGALTSVPSLGGEASVPSCKVPSYPVVERDHYVWVWMAGSSPEPTYEPHLRGLTDGLWIQQTRIWKTSVMPAVENQLDVAHTAFAHPGIYPGHTSAPGEPPPLRDLRFECRVDEDSVVVFAPPRENASDLGPSLENGDDLGLFELPYRNYVFLSADGTKEIYNWIPLDAGTCRLEFMGCSASGQAFASGTGGRQVLFLEDELELLSQDRTLLESAQSWLEKDGGASDRSVPSDAAPLMARKLVERTLRGPPSESDSEKVQRRVFSCAC